MKKHVYKLHIAYEGTRYCGWQIQKGSDTIQERVQQALFTLYRKPIFIVGAGRTDSGVHATGQIAHFSYEEALNTHRLRASLNGLLPRDIRVFAIEEASPFFHAQHGAKSKIYHYTLALGRVQCPLNRLFAWHIIEPIDYKRLSEAAALLQGRRNFSAFANSASTGPAAKDPVRHLMRITPVFLPSSIRLEFEADGFLYKMVRNLVGTLVEVATGKRPLEHIPLLLEKNDRRLAGKAAPPHGLCLIQVKY